MVFVVQAAVALIAHWFFPGHLFVSGISAVASTPIAILIGYSIATARGNRFTLSEKAALTLIAFVFCVASVLLVMWSEGVSRRIANIATLQASGVSRIYVYDWRSNELVRVVEARSVIEAFAVAARDIQYGARVVRPDQIPQGRSWFLMIKFRNGDIRMKCHFDRRSDEIVYGMVISGSPDGFRNLGEFNSKQLRRWFVSNIVQTADTH